MIKKYTGEQIEYNFTDGDAQLIQWVRTNLVDWKQYKGTLRKLFIFGVLFLLLVSSSLLMGVILGFIMEL